MEDTLFQKILLFAHGRDSFTWMEVRDEFKLDDALSGRMHHQFTQVGYINGTPLLEGAGGDKWTLGVLGQKYAMDLVEMRHATDSAHKAQKQGNKATVIAWVALLVSAFIGILQIVAQYYFR